MAQPYLCQVSTRVSCGACCGLYNMRDLSREGLITLLAARTDAFARVPREARTVEDFGRQQQGWSSEERPFPHFHHCPYLGLIGREGTRVGCLLHPEAPGNFGRDWRELSYYGAKACRTYFCPTTERLDGEYLEILRTGFDHWYLYGLVITEHRLWSAFFEELVRRVGRKVNRSDFSRHPEARAQIQIFAALKLDWPFRRIDAPGPCHFFFEDDRDLRPAVTRGDPALAISPHEVIFRELESHFQRGEAMHQAEAMVEVIFAELVRIIPG